VTDPGSGGHARWTNTKLSGFCDGQTPSCRRWWRGRAALRRAGSTLRWTPSAPGTSSCRGSTLWRPSDASQPSDHAHL